MKILLDSNAYAMFVEGNDELLELVNGAEEVLMSAVVIGELLYGFYNGSRLTENLQRLVTFLDRPQVSLLPISLATARRYGEIAASLRVSGRLIPTNDIWIAAHTIETAAELVSADKDFEAVEGLMWRSVSRN